MTSTPAKTYIAGGDAFRYPKAGDEPPVGGAKVLLLTRGGVCVTGPWSDDGRYLGWAPLPKRDKTKEASL
jgi:FMN-dependent NADH-azoreductase